MPEGPEVRRIVDQLNTVAAGRYLLSASFSGRYAKVQPEGYAELSPALQGNGIKIESVNAKGKFIYWQLSDDWTVWNTLGMSGSWTSAVEKHEVARFKLGNFPPLLRPVPEWLSFIDPRHFGTLKFVRGEQALLNKLGTLGFDLLAMKQHSVTAIWWFIREAKKASLEKPVGLVMLDQSIFCGVGNYLRAEILYEAKVSPFRLMKDVDYPELEAICRAAALIMRNSYESGGATIATYRDAEGNPGSFASRFKVYGQKVDPYGNPVSRDKMDDGRTIHWSPAIQR